MTEMTSYSVAKCAWLEASCASARAVVDEPLRIRVFKTILDGCPSDWRYSWPTSKEADKLLKLVFSIVRDAGAPVDEKQDSKLFMDVKWTSDTDMFAGDVTFASNDAKLDCKLELRVFFDGAEVEASPLAIHLVSAPETLSTRVAKQGFELTRALGSGFFSSVHEAKCISATGPYKVGELVAIKTLFDDSRRDSKELNVLMTSNTFPNCVKCLNFFSDDVSGRTSFVFEHCAGGDLAAYLASRARPIDEKLLTGWLVQLLEALVAMEKKGVTHGDIALRNLLLAKTDDPSAVKLADFGVAGFLGSVVAYGKHRSISQAPECAEGAQASPASDMWSLGFAFLQLALLCVDPLSAVAETKSDAADATSLSPQQRFDTVIARCGDSIPEYSRRFQQVLRAVLVIDPKQRASASATLALLQPIAGDPIDFHSLFKRKLGHKFVGRDRVFEKIKAWLDDRKSSPVLLITGDPGVGKSALMVELIGSDQSGDGRLERSLGARMLAYHLCSFDDKKTLAADRFVRSLASMREQQLPDVVLSADSLAALEAKACQDDPVEALVVGVLEPLSELKQAPDGKQWCLLVDSLDESLCAKGLPIAELLALPRVTDAMPPWLRVIATSRRDPRVTDLFAAAKRSVALDAQSEGGRADVLQFVAETFAADSELQRLAESSWQSPDSKAKSDVSRDSAVKQLAEHADGNFLVAIQLINALRSSVLQLKDLSTVPSKLSQLYCWSFRTYFGSPSDARWARARLLFSVMMVPEVSSIPYGQLAALAESALSIGEGVSAVEFLDLLRLAAPFVVRDVEVVVFHHKSLSDWLRRGEGGFIVDTKRASISLACALFEMIPAPRGQVDAMSVELSKAFGRKLSPLVIRPCQALLDVLQPRSAKGCIGLMDMASHILQAASVCEDLHSRVLRLVFQTRCGDFSERGADADLEDEHLTFPMFRSAVFDWRVDPTPALFDVLMHGLCVDVLRALKLLVEEVKVDVNALDEFWGSPLHVICSPSWIQDRSVALSAAKYLVQHGADVSLGGVWWLNQTPLGIALSRGCSTLADYLKSIGAPAEVPPQVPVAAPTMVEGSDSDSDDD